MANDNDIQKLTSFLETVNQIKAKYSEIKEPIKNTVTVHAPVNSSDREKKLHYLQKCLKENENCQTLLNVIESSINILLEKCIKEQQIVNANIEKCLRKQGLPYKARCHQMKIIPTAPYFKDDTGFSPPYNEDVSTRNAQGFLNPYRVIVHSLWNEKKKNAVLKYIRDVEEEKWTETLKSCGMLHMANVKQMTLKELIESRYDEYDWLKISASCLENAYSSEECQHLWFLCLHPQINQEVWSEEENTKLKTLVSQYNGQDWDKIVRELGTKRSVFLSFVHFQQHLNGRECQWSEKECDVLKYCVKLFSCKGYIQWYKLKRFIDGRGLQEMFRIWRNLNCEAKSRTFSLEEDIILVAGMKTFGYNYTRIKEYLPDRTPNQVRRRIEVLKCRQFPKQAWSTQEDDLLRKLVNKYGCGNWLKISMHFVNRSFGNVRARYNTLQQSKNVESHFSSEVITPRYKTDNVNITLLWESVLKICQDNNISINNLDNPSTNVVHELFEILKPQMRRSKTVPERKLKTFSDTEYTKFFLGAYMLNQSKPERKRNMRKMIHAFAYDVVIVLKLLEAKINLPSSKEFKNDSAISCQDRFIIKYFMKEIESRDDMCFDIFLSPNSSKQNIIDEDAGIRLDNSHYFFPPNHSTLLAMRSLFLNSKNREDQKEGLTMQMDNIELKQMNTFCSPKRINYGENHIVASKIWKERMDLLLRGVALMLKAKGKNSSDTL